MKWRQGFFRVWIIGLLICSAVAIALSYSGIAAELQPEKAPPFDPTKPWTTGPIVIPVLCKEARGTPTVDYTTDMSLRGCWYKLKNFRKLYPEYDSLSEDELSHEFYKKVFGSSGIPVTSPLPGAKASTFFGAVSLGHLIILVLALGVYIYPMSKILQRAGWSGWFSLLVLIPPANIALLWMFAFGRWPALPPKPN